MGAAPLGDREFRRRARFCRALARFPPTRRIGRRRLARLCQSLAAGAAFEGQIAGIALTLDLTDAADRDIFLFGGGDPRGVGAIEQVMARLNCRTAWDIGANRGNHGAFMRRHCRRLICFEPNPTEYRRAAQLFAADDGVTVLNIGLSSADGRLPFFIDPASSGGSSFELAGKAGNFEAQVRTGDGVARELGLTEIDFIKIDVEGHETQVLRGLTDVIERQRPVIVMEILEASNRADAGFEALLPGYRFFGNRTGLVSGITRSAYSFCRFHPGRTYMSALFVPAEKADRLADLLPR